MRGQDQRGLRSSWRLAFNGAEPVRHTTLENFGRAIAECGFQRDSFYPCYGLAEATLLVTGGQPSQAPVTRHVDETALRCHRVQSATTYNNGKTLVDSGRCPLGQCLRIVNPLSRAVRAPGEVGEIWVQGRSVSRGYWNRPEDSAATLAARLGLHAGALLRTGDLGFIDNGELLVTGRVKDLIILQGKNYYPQDIELWAAPCLPL